MALSPGTRLGVYEVSAKIGEGGMGEVYQARDTTLDRDVALKVLPEAFTSDPDRLARFEREAKVLASLNHPNIGTIYGLEEAEGVKALVLELVEGPTLADRIKQGPIPVDEALPIAKQIAEALEAAHEQGVIHRDLKPANIKVKADGTVKVLDFGLAKALDTRPDGDPSQSPTLTAAATQMGVIMGTAAYMAPEQAKGKVADKRADIWAFGVVLFEMLTGQRVFDGETVSETLAAVMMKEPAWDRSPAAVPSTLTTLIRRCLQKDPRQRVRDIGDVRLGMEGAFDTTVGTHPPPSVEPATLRATRERVWMAATVVATLLAVALAVLYVARTPTAPTTVRFSIDASSPALGGGGLALSPDGTRLVFDDPQGLWLRSIGELDPRLLPGTEGGRLPFWSPDGRSIGFFSTNELKTVDLTGGSPQTVSSVAAGFGGTWSEDDVIVFGQLSGELSRVSAQGGEPVPLVVPEAPGDPTYTWPKFLPDGDHFLFLVTSTDGRSGGIGIGSLEAGTRSPPILQTEAGAQYVEPGYLLFERGGALMAQRFDLERLDVTGDPVRVVDEMATVPLIGQALFAASDQGGLAYRTSYGSTLTQIRLLDRTGMELGLVGPPGDYGDPVLSRDEARVAVERDGDIWLLDLMRGTDQRFTFTARNFMPIWSPAGDRILFGSASDTGLGVYERETAGTGPPRLVLESDVPVVLSDWSPDGETVSYHYVRESFDLWRLPMSGSREPTSVLATPFHEAWGTLSPDGRWLAYG